MENSIDEKQSSKNVDIEPLASGINERFKQLLGRLGAINVAKRVGQRPQVYYNIVQGRVRASLPTILEVVAAYPEEEGLLLWIMTDQSQDHAEPAGSTYTPDNYLQTAVAQIEEKLRLENQQRYESLIDEKERQIRDAAAREQRMWELLGKNKGVIIDPAFQNDALLLATYPAANWGTVQATGF